MRVAFDISPLTVARSGVGNYCYFLLKHLLQTDAEYIGFSSGRAAICLDDLAGRLRVRHNPVPTKVLYKLWSLLGIPRVDKWLDGVDIVHATNYFLPPTASAKRVLTIHDLSFLVLPQLCNTAITAPFASRMKGFAAHADAIMTYSESTRSDVIEYLGADPAKITVAPMAVDEGFQPVERNTAKDFVREQYGIAEPFLLFVSTLEPRKNVPTLLKAFARIATDVPHRLVLIGSVGWNAEGIFEMIDKLGLADRVIRPGFVPHPQLPHFYCAADAFVFPTAYEGFGLPLLEAQTCGCPVITSDNSSVPEVMGDAAILHDAYDVEGISESILSVVHDKELRDDMISRGLKHAANYSWHECARATFDVYRKILS